MGGVWLAWLAGWINRVELRMRAEGSAAALGLQFEREGVLARVVAAGTVAGVPLRVRWRLGWEGRVVEVALRGGAWAPVPAGEELGAWVAARAAAEASP